MGQLWPLMVLLKMSLEVSGFCDVVDTGVVCGKAWLVWAAAGVVGLEKT